MLLTAIPSPHAMRNVVGSPPVTLPYAEPPLNDDVHPDFGPTLLDGDSDSHPDVDSN